MTEGQSGHSRQSKISLSYSPSSVLAWRADRQKAQEIKLPFLSPPRRPRRAHEWSAGKIVTFIVTLAATQSVTLAARDAGMSRKSAYALKARDPAFAASWNAALKVREGDKVEEMEGPTVSLNQGDSRNRAAPSTSSTGQRHAALQLDAIRRDRFFSRLAGLHKG